MASPAIANPFPKAARCLVLAALALLIAVSALPYYRSGWPWASPPDVPHVAALKTLQQKGLALPGWETQEQSQISLGGHDWSVQQIAPATPNAANPIAQAALLLRPQVWYADQPEVEWLDIRGSQQWTVDSRQRLTFTVPVPEQLSSAQADSAPTQVTADFFRAWNPTQTYAVLQWYAWPTGGHPALSRWFWLDQKAQLQKQQRLPWVAVSLLIPIPPLGDIQPYLESAEALAETVQQALIDAAFQA
ncbi:cyanoexosortase B system-associated protein [Romeria aff. gracilis LEGE 07310]|uniref:Cyanoexosortase B system-associated protein n=1 Tax=Vasconcelosia minhoensis LEGE 07310 TaxID=915328 RepID=A0A8J7AN02_9CYAN|nr:cyanoexosortase B system-associated protein [Romeria gracilis]MBE9077484.1 cyanoexosortase B system-associated protein [Romeria aff. gracilis LEGE 07310]